MYAGLDERLRQDIERFYLDFLAANALRPGDSLAVKAAWINRFGIEEHILLAGQVSWPDRRLPPPSEWACLRLEDLRKIILLPDLEPGELAGVLNDTRCTFHSAEAFLTVLFHAANEPQFTSYTAPEHLLAAFYRLDAAPWLEHLTSPTAALHLFEPNPLNQSRAILANPAKEQAHILLNRGLLAGGEDPETCIAAAAKISKIVKDNLTPPASVFAPQADANLAFEALPQLRDEICAQRGHPLVLHLDDTPEMRDFIDSKEFQDLLINGAPTPQSFLHVGLPMQVERNSSKLSELPEESPAETTLALKPGLGAIIAARSMAEANGAADEFRTVVDAIRTAGQAAGFHSVESEKIHMAVGWETQGLPERSPFCGEIGLVTGAASGIGKAIVSSLLQRGCAVAGVDINPAIRTTFDHPAYLGVVCDVASEEAVCQTLATVVRHFGGLDILVLNAGLFPSGCNISALSLTEFTKVINVNFLSNLILMREAYPLLRKSPRYGRVVVIGSKNMRAPGPGAAAYSSSKAALTQLARVAALEWGSERIRVNVIHPDSVFDTALYTEEVLQSRAAHYGMTVEQYKKRNLLKTEITSHDVAELVAEMCGPLFRAMTGGQIQFDGGNDRTI
jgi:NAD(P)-dependent dehydrogenase (short-subunit alcohol dehydrogenase family)/rhamnose utilization protein RhaD (predicted bifunctional aldolase and dehydrogenase)